MKIKYRLQDYEARLHGGVVLYGGVPHMVQTAGESVNLVDLVNGRAVLRGIDPMHHNLDISSPPLGYIQGDEYAVYMMRIPHRRYKQSLDSRAICEYRLDRNGLVQDDGEGHSRWLNSAAFRDSYVKPYSSFDAARKLLTDEKVVSVAMSRDVAMFMDELGLIKVYYKMELIGFIAPGSRTVVVPSSDKAWVISMYFNELGWEVQ